MTNQNKLKNLLIVGDKVLIKPKTDVDKTRGGLFLPPSVIEKESVQSGYIIKVGPGFPIPFSDDEEPWKKAEDKARYIPLQVKEGDLAIYVQAGAIEVQYAGEKYFIVPQHSILMIEREEL